MREDTRNRRNVALVFFGGMALGLFLLFTPALFGLMPGRFGFIFFGATVLFLTVMIALSLWSRHFQNQPYETIEPTATTSHAALVEEPVAPPPPQSPRPDEGEGPSP